MSTPEDYVSDSVELKFGRWQDRLADVTADVLIVDAPYSERTHKGHDRGTAEVNRAERGRVNRSTGQIEKGWQRAEINYSAWTDADVQRCVDSWSPRVRGWFVTITDHVLARSWEAHLQQAGRYVFAPLPFVETGSRVRMGGDGPSNWTCWVVVARPCTREFQRWGTLDGSYVDTAEKKAVTGGKGLRLMRALVRDYSRPGDLIVDPCAGGSTTLLAAAMEGRRAIGSEMDIKHFEISKRRLSKGFTTSLFAESAGRVGVQTNFLDDEK